MRRLPAQAYRLMWGMLLLRCGKLLFLCIYSNNMILSNKNTFWNEHIHGCLYYMWLLNQNIYIASSCLGICHNYRRKYPTANVFYTYLCLHPFLWPRWTLASNRSFNENNSDTRKKSGFSRDCWIMRSACRKNNNSDQSLNYYQRRPWASLAHLTHLQLTAEMVWETLPRRSDVHRSCEPSWQPDSVAAPMVLEKRRKHLHSLTGEN